jgi:hypothetical protein
MDEENTIKNLQVKKKIKNALNYIRNDSFEVRSFYYRLDIYLMIRFLFRYHLLHFIVKNILNLI